MQGPGWDAFWDEVTAYRDPNWPSKSDEEAGKVPIWWPERFRLARQYRDAEDNHIDLDTYANVVHLANIAKSQAKAAKKRGPLKQHEGKTLHVWQSVNHRLIELGEKPVKQAELDKRWAQYFAWSKSVKVIETEPCSFCNHDYAAEVGTCPDCRRTRSKAERDLEQREWLESLVEEEKLPILADFTIWNLMDDFDWEDEGGQTEGAVLDASKAFLAWREKNPKADICNRETDGWMTDWMVKHAAPKRRAKR